MQRSAYWGGFRTEGDSVFFNSVANNKDILVYDFSLMVGDTITLKSCFPYNYDYYRPFMCESMYGDSLVWQAKVTERFYDKNNLLHLKLEHTLDSDMREFYKYDEWVKGIGSILYGPLHGYLRWATATCGGCFTTEQKLACFKQNDKEEYKLCETCFGTIDPPPYNSLSETELLFHLSVHNGALQLKTTSSDLPALIDLFDPTGKVIFSQIISEQQTTFDLSHLPKGVLMYQITPLEGKRETGKVMNR